jgi:hypothetical protein
MARWPCRVHCQAQNQEQEKLGTAPNGGDRRTNFQKLELDIFPTSSAETLQGFLLRSFVPLSFN